MNSLLAPTMLFRFAAPCFYSKELWSASPGFNVANYAISYRGANNKQYVVISGPRIVAYALP